MKSLAQLGVALISNVNLAGASASGIPPDGPRDIAQSTLEWRFLVLACTLADGNSLSRRPRPSSRSASSSR